MKKQLKQYLQFSAKELLIFFILLLVVAGFLLYPKLFKTPNTSVANISTLESPKNNVNASTKEEYSFNNKQPSNNNQFLNNNTSTKSSLNPFSFNPNELDYNGFIKLGLREKTIKTILNYRSKGGKFYKAEDFRKIWGLKKEEADVLIPFIVLESNKNYSLPNYQNNVKHSALKRICINTASAYEFKSIPALGNLAFKIVNFREKLGGFTTIQQVAETYGITDSIFNAILPYLTITNNTINQLNINLASEFELSKHPYISKDVARAIVIYRNQHGNYTSVDDLKKIVFLKADIIERIKPYLTV